MIFLGIYSQTDLQPKDRTDFKRQQVENSKRKWKILNSVNGIKLKRLRLSNVNKRNFYEFKYKENQTEMHNPSTLKNDKETLSTFTSLRCVVRWRIT
ncbi:CLUMA_CG019340, isoform A [Clunio marinus]|uniref:CLUMA_CG019340, isoform A n=1 Tax=Clunio marinus TaxID=568069 RepID=A0A1J1J109_9DIPT|nr:CLUMA_CG019340, isoform A [Clunio marinus]